MTKVEPDVASVQDSTHPKSETTSAEAASPTPDPEKPMKKSTRRALLTAALGGMAAIKTAPKTRAGKFAQDWVYALLNRISHGYTLDDADQAATMGFQAYLDYQLDPASIDDSALETYLQGIYNTVYMATSQDIHDYASIPGNGNVPNSQLIEWATLQYIFSKKHLFNRMVNCWSNHFSIAIENAKWLKTMDDRLVIRQNALGLFPRMLDASARSAAMYAYLDNQSNHKDAPNENYSRELMELHTLGLNGPYTENDVKEVARCFTGMRFSGPPTYGEFRYVDNAHDHGSKTVLGTFIPPNQGVGDIDSVVDILWNHASTKRYIASEMICWLLEDNPDPDLVIEVAREYHNTNGNIESMIRVILTPANLQRACMTPRFRTAFDWVAGLIRASSVDFNNVIMRGLNGVLDKLQHRPFQWGPPNGYPKSKQYWAPNQITRWRIASEAMDPVTNPPQDFLGINIPDVFAGVGGMNPNHVVRQINTIYAHDNMSIPDLQALQAYANQAGPIDDQVVRDLLSLAVSAPSFQLY